MTPKITRFLTQNDPATPCLIVDLDSVEQQFSTMKHHFDGASIYYAIKANPAPAILKRLNALGAFFDVASLGEIQQCLAAGISAEKLSFGHTVKNTHALREAHKLGVSLFAFDCEEELHKIARYAPNSRVFCRLTVLNTGADWPLSDKFGTTTDHAYALMLQAEQLNLKATGLSFHVGSQQTSAEAYQQAIAQASTLFQRLQSQGLALDLLNIGGGLPSHYTRSVPDIDYFSTAINQALSKHFPHQRPRIMLEPGRALVGDAGVVRSEVVLTSRRGGAPTDPRWVYLDIGRFGGLAETEGEAIRYRFRTPHDDTSHSQSPCIIAGPTCDSVDVMYEKNRMTLPDELASGDKILILATGAYVSTYCSTGFNGFAPLNEYYI